MNLKKNNQITIEPNSIKKLLAFFALFFYYFFLLGTIAIFYPFLLL